MKVKVGISTASFFKRSYNEDTVRILNERGVGVTEVFLGTYREYKPEFARLLSERKRSLEVHSVHTLNTHFEPQLFSANPRALDDAYDIARDVLASARILGAKYYTFHGVARVKKGLVYRDYDGIGEKFNALCSVCSEYGVALALENVEWAFYNHPGFFSEIKRRCPLLKGTLDIKQARDAGEGYVPYLEEMGSDIVTVHVSDIDENGRLCLPGKGIFDFAGLMQRLAGVGFGGAILIEVYNENYGGEEELYGSLDYLGELASKYFG